ncbi:MAG: hypothetical protein ABF628_12295, partial [Acetobacter orientalis]
CSVWLGPLIVYIFQPLVGVGGVMAVYAALFVLSGVLVYFIKLPQELEANAAAHAHLSSSFSFARH